MKFKELVALVLMLVVCIALTGCQVKEPRSSFDLAPTDELILYTSSSTDYWLPALIQQYEEIFGINVTEVRVEGEYLAYSDRLVSDLVAGEGPDVIFVHMLYTDLSRAIQNHSFTDLTDLLEQDESFARENYVEGVFAPGCVRGRQYTVPLSFFSPAYLSSQPRLEALGFEWDTSDSMGDFLNRISQLLPFAQLGTSFSQMMESKNRLLIDFLPYSGINLLDYENNVVLLDEEEFRSFCHAYKAYFPCDYDESLMSSSGNIGFVKLLVGEFFFWGFSRIDDVIFNASILKTNGGYELSLLPSQSGETIGMVYEQMAIRANSRNQQNAYNFIRMMLSEEVQSSSVQHSVIQGLPVHKKAIERLVEESRVKYNPSFPPMYGYLCAQLTEQEADEIAGKITAVDRYIQPISGHVFQMMYETMLPFFKDEQSYEVCVDALRSKLTIYLSE